MFGFLSFYSFLFVLVFFLYVGMSIAFSQDKKVGIVIFWTIAILLYCISAIRGFSVGGDLHYYFRDFQDAIDSKSFSGFFEVSNKEPGFTLLVWMISIITDSKRLYLIFTSFFSLVGPFCFIKKYSKWPVVSIIIYFLIFYSNTFNNVRQSIAISFICFSCDMLLSKKFKSYIILTLLATSIHFSAFVFLSAFILKKLKLSLKNIIITYVLGLFAYSFIITDILTILLSVVVTKYGDSALEESAGRGYGLSLLYFFIFLCLYVVFTKIKLSSIDYGVIKTLLFFIVILPLIQLCATHLNILSRLTTYFYVFIVVLIPNLLINIKNVPVRRLSCITAIILYYVFACLTIYAQYDDTGSNGQGVIPYYIGNE